MLPQGPPPGLSPGSGSIPPGLLAALSQAQGPPPPGGPGLGPPDGDPDDSGQGPPSPLAALQMVIQLLPSLMSALPDAKDTQDVARCLLVLTGVQARMMGNGGGGGGQGSGGGSGSGY